MNGIILDPLLEPVLWFLVSVCFLIVALYFCIFKYRTMGEEARPFILGLIIFTLLFMIGRTLETIARYYFISGSYYILLHLLYFIIPYTGNAIFYFVFEKYIMKKGINKNTRYILTIFAIIEGIVLSLIIFSEGTFWFVLIVIASVGFLVIGFFPVGLFIYLSFKAPTRHQKLAWLVIMVGFIFFIVSVVIDLPEAAFFAQNFSVEFIHFGAPIMQALGVILMGFGFAILYKNV